MRSIPSGGLELLQLRVETYLPLRNLFMATLFLKGKLPTHYPSDPKKNPDVIDFGFIKGISRHNVHVQLLEEHLSSDHVPVQYQISFCPMPICPPDRLHNKATDWDLFKEYVHDRIQLYSVSKIETPQDLEKDLELFVRVLQDAAREATPPPRKFFAAHVPKSPKLEYLLHHKKHVSGFTTERQLISLFLITIQELSQLKLLELPMIT